MTDNAAALSPLPADVDAPLFAVLDHFEDCEAILARNTVGRLAFALQDRVTGLTDSDPVPFRDQLFRIRAVEISGRSSEPSGGRTLTLRAENPVGQGSVT
jgi:hypothetical protein